MGLGLYIVSEVMRVSHGRIVFPSGGDIDLPDQIDGAVIALQFLEPRMISQLASPSVCIIDDEENRIQTSDNRRALNTLYVSVVFTFWETSPWPASRASLYAPPARIS